ncbi:MAG: hypothetical protein ACRD0H_02250, partial [Actinomycetes bacterium]
MAPRKKLITSVSAVVAALLLATGTSACGEVGGGAADLTYWSMWKVGEPQQKVLAEAVADFEKETGLTVDVQWQGRDNLQKLVPALNTNSVPDLVDGPYVKAYPALVATDQARSLGAAYDLDVDGRKVADLVPAKYRTTVDIALP